MLSRKTIFTVLSLAVLTVGCGDAPLASIGERSSAWINEPEVTTTTVLQVEAPRVAEAITLQWHNDGIATEALEGGDVDAIVGEVFARREGDRFVQASRYEIVAVLPEVEFPDLVPAAASWVSSQLVIENNGRLSAEPTVAFGIWSSVPYRSSRTVAQMAVLRVSNDPVTAEEMAQPDAALSCGRFAEAETVECLLVRLGGREVWKLSAASGTTLIWFDGELRYELFGRSFVTVDVLEEMVISMLPLVDLVYPDRDAVS